MTEEQIKKDLQCYIRMGKQLTGSMWLDYHNRCIKPLEDKLKDLQERRRSSDELQNRRSEV